MYQVTVSQTQTYDSSEVLVLVNADKLTGSEKLINLARLRDAGFDFMGVIVGGGMITEDYTRLRNHKGKVLYVSSALPVLPSEFRAWVMRTECSYCSIDYNTGAVTPLKDVNALTEVTDRSGFLFGDRAIYDAAEPLLNGETDWNYRNRDDAFWWPMLIFIIFYLIMAIVDSENWLFWVFLAFLLLAIMLPLFLLP